jgi:hypothetical protein
MSSRAHHRLVWAPITASRPIEIVVPARPMVM